MSNLEAKRSKFDNDTQKQVIPLTGKRCPPGYRINKETGMCELFNPPTLKKTKTKKVKSEKKDLKLESSYDLDEIIKKTLEGENYNYMDMLDVTNIMKNTDDTHKDFILKNNINFLKIIKEYNIKYSNSKKENINNITRFMHMISKKILNFIFIEEGLDEFYSFYNEKDFEDIRSDEEWWINEIDELIIKINLLNNDLKELKDFGIFINEKYLNKLNILINKCNDAITIINLKLNTNLTFINKVKIIKISKTSQKSQKVRSLTNRKRKKTTTRKIRSI